MSYPAIYITVGSVGRAWAVQLFDESGAPVNLTLVTSAKFSMALRSGGARKVDDAGAVVANGTYTLADGSARTFTPADGVLIYQPVTGDVDTDGIYQGQFTYSLGGQLVIDPGAGYVEINIQKAV